MGQYRYVGMAVIAAATLSTASHAALVQVRDAPGGEGADGVSDGLFLTGTGNHVRGTMTGGAPVWFMEMGTLSLQADRGAGFNPFLTYCIEPTGDQGFGLNPLDPVGLTFTEAALTTTGFSGAEEVILEKLWSNAFAVSTTDRQLASAFQSIIWELVLDPVFDLSNGSFAIDDSHMWSQEIKGIAQQWMTNINNGTWSQSTQLLALTSPDTQDYLAPAIVPSPGALALLMASAFMGVWTRRRRVM